MEGCQVRQDSGFQDGAFQRDRDIACPGEVVQGRRIVRHFAIGIAQIVVGRELQVRVAVIALRGVEEIVHGPVILVRVAIDRGDRQQDDGFAARGIDFPVDRIRGLEVFQRQAIAAGDPLYPGNGDQDVGIEFRGGGVLAQVLKCLLAGRFGFQGAAEPGQGLRPQPVQRGIGFRAIPGSDIGPDTGPGLIGQVEGILRCAHHGGPRRFHKFGIGDGFRERRFRRRLGVARRRQGQGSHKQAYAGKKDTPEHTETHRLIKQGQP